MDTTSVERSKVTQALVCVDTTSVERSKVTQALVCVETTSGRIGPEHVSKLFRRQIRGQDEYSYYFYNIFTKSKNIALSLKYCWSKVSAYV